MNEIPEPQPNPRRVAAGRANRAKRGPLTAAGRALLQVAALRTKPWKHATGPKTPAGKRQAALNGRTRQIDTLSIRQMRAELAGVRALIGEIRDTCAQLGG